MDASYLNTNVNVALSEAMTSMAVLSPDDPVEFLGQYLLKFVERKILAQNSSKESEAAELKLADYMVVEEAKAKGANEAEAKKLEKQSQFESFLKSLHTCKTKEAAMDTAVAFMESDLNIPAAYVGVKKVVGEAETLYYLSASPSQEKVTKGKKLARPSADEGEEGPIERLGISFEAFKLPDVPEEEPEELEEGAEPKPPKPAPKMSPIVIDNAMREKKCQFFGIPKLGAFVACPFEYSSVEHEAGCLYIAPDAEAGTAGGYQMNPIKSYFVIGFDSVGCYRLFSPEEIEKVNLIGEELSLVFGEVEGVISAQHLEFLSSEKLNTSATLVAGMLARWGDIEAAAAAEAARSMEPPAEETDPPPEPAHELKGPAVTNEMVIIALSTQLAEGLPEPLASLAEHPMSPGNAACSLLYLLACLASPSTAQAICLDCCGMPSWPVMKANLMPQIVSLMTSFSPSARCMSIPKAVSVASVKASCEAQNLFDSSVYPTNLPVFPFLSQWVNKALAARDASVAYAAEGLQSPIESTV
jgi:hypothetical protein